jgi:hypothetical protein
MVTESPFNKTRRRSSFVSARSSVFHLLAIVQDEIHVLVETDDLPFQHVSVRGVFVQPESALCFSFAGNGR